MSVGLFWVSKETLETTVEGFGADPVVGGHVPVVAPGAGVGSGGVAAALSEGDGFWAGDVGRFGSTHLLGFGKEVLVAEVEGVDVDGGSQERNCLS